MSRRRERRKDIREGYYGRKDGHQRRLREKMKRRRVRRNGKKEGNPSFLLLDAGVNGKDEGGVTNLRASRSSDGGGGGDTTFFTDAI
jgi:hypothetical protein